MDTPAPATTKKSNPFDELASVVQLDEASKYMNSQDDPNKNKKAWAQKYWWIIGMVLVVGFDLIGGSNSPKKSHHGINKYGERY